MVTDIDVDIQDNTFLKGTLALNQASTDESY